jgi:predicted ATPase
LDFLRSSAFRDIPEYLREKGLNFEELKSQLNDGQNKPIEFISIFEFPIDKGIQELSWYLQIDQKNGNWLIKDEMKDISAKREIYSEECFFRDSGKSRSMTAGDLNAAAGSSSAIANNLTRINFQSSWLKYIPETTNEQLLKPLLDYLSGSVFYGLLSPDYMRKGNGQTIVGSIGINGINLAACIHNMTPHDREKLEEAISKLVDYKLKIKTADVGRIELYIEEEFGSAITRINKDHISDGLLRIIAFAVISSIENTITKETAEGVYYYKTGSGDIFVSPKTEGLILLDEIENGINPYLTERFISLLRNLAEESNRQVIISTHSPVMLNDFKPEEIIFLWRDKNGSVHAKKFFDTEEMREALSFLNPGEIWENFGKDTILTKLGVNQEDR